MKWRRTSWIAGLRLAETQVLIKHLQVVSIISRGTLSQSVGLYVPPIPWIDLYKPLTTNASSSATIHNLITNIWLLIDAVGTICRIRVWDMRAGKKDEIDMSNEIVQSPDATHGSVILKQPPNNS